MHNTFLLTKAVTWILVNLVISLKPRYQLQLKLYQFEVLLVTYSYSCIKILGAKLSHSGFQSCNWQGLQDGEVIHIRTGQRKNHTHSAKDHYLFTPLAICMFAQAYQSMQSAEKNIINPSFFKS